MRVPVIAMLIVLAGVIGSVPAAEVRTWTDRAGRQFEGEFEGFTDGQVQVRRASDGQMFRLPLERFSDADQQFVKSQAQVQARPVAPGAKRSKGPANALADRAADTGRPLRVAYFVPADREPEPDYPARLDRVMTHIQAFYRHGMKANGHGPMTFRLERTANNQLNIIVVKGKDMSRAYDRESRDRIRQEVREEFARQGLDFEREVVVIFQTLLLREPGQTTEIGPFVGGGNGNKGSALVFDDVRLDAAALGSNQLDPFWKDGKTIGDFNTRYIGGIAHELGHAFGLGHDAERPMLRQRFGRSLMGRGNNHYGKELRGKGPGAFLTAASALPLTFHPLFTGHDLDDRKPDVTIDELSATTAAGGLVLSGRVSGNPTPVGLIALNDPASEPLDYDAVGWPTRLKPDGTFRLPIADLLPGAYDLQLRVYCENGQAQRFAYAYNVDSRGVPDVSPLTVAR